MNLIKRRIEAAFAQSLIQDAFSFMEIDYR